MDMRSYTLKTVNISRAHNALRIALSANQSSTITASLPSWCVRTALRAGACHSMAPVFSAAQVHKQSGAWSAMHRLSASPVIPNTF